MSAIHWKVHPNVLYKLGYFNLLPTNVWCAMSGLYFFSAIHVLDYLLYISLLYCIFDVYSALWSVRYLYIFLYLKKVCAIIYYMWMFHDLTLKTVIWFEVCVNLTNNWDQIVIGSVLTRLDEILLFIKVWHYFYSFISKTWYWKALIVKTKLLYLNFIWWPVGSEVKITQEIC